MEDVYRNIENYNPGKKRKILIVFDYMIADMITNKKELFIRIENLIFLLYLLLNRILKCQKMLD